MSLIDVIRRRLKKEKEFNFSKWNQRQPLPEISKIIDGKRYSSLDAKCIAQGPTYGTLFIPQFTWLYQTSRKNFFCVYQQMNEMISLRPIEDEQMARHLYEQLEWQDVDYQTAFPEAKVEDA